MAIIHEGLGKDIKLLVINVPWLPEAQATDLLLPVVCKYSWLTGMLREHWISSCGFTVILWGASEPVGSVYLHPALGDDCFASAVSVLQACPLPAHSMASAFNLQASGWVSSLLVAANRGVLWKLWGKNNKPTCFLVLSYFEIWDGMLMSCCKWEPMKKAPAEGRDGVSPLKHIQGWGWGVEQENSGQRNKMQVRLKWCLGSWRKAESVPGQSFCRPGGTQCPRKPSIRSLGGEACDLVFTRTLDHHLGNTGLRNSQNTNRMGRASLYWKKEIAATSSFEWATFGEVVGETEK